MAGPGREDINSAILRELRANARLPLAALSRRVGLSRSAVKQRIERLERAKIIRGYTVLLTDGAEDDPAISAILFVERTDRLRGRGVTVKLASLPGVVTCHVLAGDPDILLEVREANVERLRVIAEAAGQIDGVSTVRLHLVLASPPRSRF